MSQYPEKKPSGRANFVWVLGGGYLVYTAYKLIRDLINGQSEMYALSIVTAVIFAAVGGWMLWREWKAYKYGKDHIDDPSTWSLDDDEETKVIGVALNNITDGYNFLESMVSSLGVGLGFLLAMVLFAGVRSRIENCPAPKAMQGLPVTLIAASIVSLAFFGFAGIVDNIFALW